MRDMLLGGPVELKLPARRNMMLVLRLTTAGVIARAGLTVDRMDDVKMAVEEAASCLIGDGSGDRLLCLRFEDAPGALEIRVCLGCEAGDPVSPEELTVVRCILEALVDQVELQQKNDAIAAVILRVALEM